MSESNQSNQKPVQVFRHGGVVASIWKNYNDGKAYYNVTLQYRYKTKPSPENTDGEWKSSQSINYRDLPAASMVMTRACNWIAHQLGSKGQGDE